MELNFFLRYTHTVDATQIFQDKVTWFQNPDIVPYVFVRDENLINQPGKKHRLNWFSKRPIIKDPLDLKELPFAEYIYHIENIAFGPSAMPMPRWVFYDCAVMPGFVCGFAYKKDKMPTNLKAKFPDFGNIDYVPLSLFIIIPTMHKGEWVAHNLCSVNSFLDKKDQFYGLGFLSKAFGLWYANVELCSGMTQWGSPALKLHSHYGHLEVIGAYAPVHSHAKTVTYRAQVNASTWELFFSKDVDLEFLEQYEKSGLEINPTDEKSMIEIQNKIQNNEGPFYLNASEILGKGLNDPLSIYRPKGF